MNFDIKHKYNEWILKASKDCDLIPELKNMTEEQKEDAFYKELEFGTGGLRGIIGAGTNRINVYTVSKATQGICDYIKKTFSFEKQKVVISYDSRIKSDYFAKAAASVFASNGIKVFIFPHLTPVPILSFTTRFLHCCTGVMITASHNPAKYNGYKVYGEDGCQITTEAAKTIYSFISSIDVFDGFKTIDFEEAISNGIIEYVNDIVVDEYIKNVKSLSLLKKEKVCKDFAIVYTPLNGTGLKPIQRVLREEGFSNFLVVPEQERPDGNFPTCPYPNPEVKEALSLGIEYCKKNNADLLLATDPDCDRVGIAIKTDDQQYTLLTGNETGLLLLDYICSRRIVSKTMPCNPVFIKTIVTTDLAEDLASNYGVETINVLTGFKFIGEKIGFLEKQGRAKDFVFGMEESYGYLSGTFVRDKDAVIASFLICEMFAFYKSNGISLIEKLNEIWKKYGYCCNTLHSYEFNGPSGFAFMQNIMKSFRGTVDKIGGYDIVQKFDYLEGLDSLPKSDVLKFVLKNNSCAILRPSGTEPKLKLYISVRSDNKEKAKKIENCITIDFERYIK